jgi:selenium metabolism protein YedF
VTDETRHLDCRGKLCPRPLLETRRAIEELPEGSLVVLVDHPAAKENVARAMADAGHEVLIEENNAEWHLTITKCAVGALPAGEESAAPGGKLRTVVLAADAGLGRSDSALGRILMKSFVAIAADLPAPPDEVILMQAGVRLVCEGSDCLDGLRQLEERGVRILACGTCLDYFGLMDKVRVGTISNMAEIVEALMRAGRIIPL